MELTYHQRANKTFAKYFFGSCGMCLFYLLAVQLGYSVYHAMLSAKNGTGYIAPFGADLVYLAAMWVPFFIMLFMLIRKNGIPAFRISCINAFKKHWFKFGLYFLFLYAVRQNMGVGYYYVELPGGGLWLDSSFLSELTMIFVHYLSETVSTVILFAVIPFFCYVSWNMKACPAEKLLSRESEH